MSNEELHDLTRQMTEKQKEGEVEEERGNKSMQMKE